MTYKAAMAIVCATWQYLYVLVQEMRVHCVYMLGIYQSSKHAYTGLLLRDVQYLS